VTYGAPPLPEPRGPLSEALFDLLPGPPRRAPRLGEVGDPWGEDLQLALYCCYELHYRSFAGVPDGWEWHPPLLAWRAELEEAFEVALRQACEPAGAVAGDHPGAAVDVVEALRAQAAADGPSLSAHMEAQGTLEQFREFVVHRSPYQLKEADPHTWAIPRLEGTAKAAVVHVQMEEYGEGVEAAMHSTLFAGTMAALGLDASYGRYLDLVPATTLATTNLISMFGLHRRLRGALVGHLALFEMTSVTPMARYSAALARLGAPAEARRFYDVHIEADEVHGDVALHDMAASLGRQHPDLAADIAFGAVAANLVEGRFAAALLDAWAAGRTSLRAPLPG
jgi:hypothetical protein